MSLTENTQTIIENIISSYEDRVKNMGAVLDSTYQILEDFQDSILDTQQQKEKVNSQIRDILAKNEHLRKKDFDMMMQGVLLTQDVRQKEVRNLLKTYLNEQKTMAQALREKLEKFRDSLAKGEVQRVKEFHQILKENLAKQEERKNEVISKLEKFQKEQKDLAKRLKELLAKGKDLRIKDLKLMIREFDDQYQKRITRQEERGEEIRNLLANFKKERGEWTKNRLAEQKKIA